MNYLIKANIIEINLPTAEAWACKCAHGTYFALDFGGIFKETQRIG